MTVHNRHREKKVHRNKVHRGGKKTMAEVKKPSDLPKAKKHKPMDSSDEDDEEAASSQRPSASTNSEDEYTDDDEYGDGESGPAIQSARSHDSGRTVLYPDLYVLTNDEHWTVTPETHKHAAAGGSFCFVTTENGE